MVLVAREVQDAPSAFDQFEPYDYGPFDSAVYRELASLRIAGLIRDDLATGARARRISTLTDAGTQEAETIRAEMPAETVAQVAEIKTRLTSRTFSELLAHIYERYPDMKVNSIAPEALRSA